MRHDVVVVCAGLAGLACARAFDLLDGVVRGDGWLERILGPVQPAAVLRRHWGRDPYALDYVSQRAPGDLTTVGPLHGTHEPPFFVAGSDHWAAGYVEGAVATGRGAARVILGESADVYR